MAESHYLAGSRCMECGQEYPVKPFRYTCASCGQNLDFIYNYQRIRKHWSRKVLKNDGDRSLWRYSPLLPVSGSPQNRTLQSGGTPLVSLPNTAREFGIAQLYIKDDCRNPSGSLKDRATEVAIQHSIEEEQSVMIAASTGNAASSLAALGAHYGRRVIILAPGSAPAGKLTQVLQHGALLGLIDGSYDEAFDLVGEIVQEYGWYNRCSGINPVLSEGKKTAALEIAEQLDWQPPDQIFVPVGDGCIIGGIYKGFSDLLQLGWIESIPRIIAVQANGSSAIVDALESGEAIMATSGNTIADGIAVSYPRDGLKAVRAVQNSNGYGLKVSDEEILQAQHTLAKTAGLFVEPAAAAAYAGFLSALNQGRIKPNESIAILTTGTGLKDTESARKVIQVPDMIAPTLAAFRDFLTTSAYPQSGDS